MLVRIAQRPQLARRRHDHVQRGDRRLGRSRRRGGDPGADITAVRVGLLADQREVPLGVVSPSTSSAYGRAPSPAGRASRSLRCGPSRGPSSRTVGVTPARPPAVAHRTCATNAGDSACRAPRSNSWSRTAGSGCLSSTTPPSEPNSPAPPRPRCGGSLSSESGASSSQNVALTRFCRGQPEQPAHDAEPTPERRPMNSRGRASPPR